MDFSNLLWLIPVLPLIGSAINGLVGKRLSNSVVGIVACASVGLSFVISLGAFAQMLQLPEGQAAINHNYFTWIQSGTFEATFGLMLDHLSGIFILIITGVGFLIHIYATGYMAHEDGFYRFFAYLNLFVFFMLCLVLGNNYLLMFVGWEGVGLCSYLLIGFYFSKKSAGDAGKKAFVVNRVGDFGFILAIMLIFWTFGSVDFGAVFEKASDAAAFPIEPFGTFGTFTIIGLLLLLGATGKSAQIPLYVWLPDAMEGPTPVSALIHAATMVTAGVYMVARSAMLYSHTATAMFVVALIGGATAIFAATIGLVQNDIKKVLAYSTVSQLGYMFLGCGVGAFSAGVFHVMTHAFFKALLFLGAGSVIHGMSGIQDIRKMGGLKKEMPWTFRTFLVGGLAIAGVPGLAGFFSKDEILWKAWNYEHGGPIFWLIGVVAAGCTAFYTFRLIFLTFFGAPRYSHHDVHHVHESPASMVVPLVVLALLSVVGGYVGVPAVLGGSNQIEHFLEGVSPVSEAAHGSHELELGLMAASTLVGLLGIFLAYYLYLLKPQLLEKKSEGGLYRLLWNKYYVDEAYDATIVNPTVRTSRDFLWRFVDAGIIDGTVNGFGTLVRGSAAVLRYVQSGYVRSYVGWIVFGGALIIAWLLRP